jgi:DmsE family decaheme c-type cytochrome
MGRISMLDSIKAVSLSQGGQGSVGLFKSSRKRATLAAAGVICWALAVALSYPAGAEERQSSDGTYSALLAYVQGVEGVEPKLVRAEQSAPQNDAPQAGVYADLAAFVRDIGGDVAQPAPAAHPSIVPPNYSRIDDDAYSALRSFLAGVEPGQIQLAAADPAKPAKTKTKTVKTPKLQNPDDATYVGEKVCLTCHTSQASTFATTLMGKIFKNPRSAQEKGGCETCHGAGSAHVAAGGGRGVGGIISFRVDDKSRTPEENNAICLSCHERGDRTYWNGSTHESRGLACTNCHTVMRKVSVKAQLNREVELETCFQCHKDRRAQVYRTSHMPVREGNITCSNCHNPHGSATEGLLRQASVNDNCYSCHAEKRGPYLWEHPPVRDDPHGSVNEFLLKMARPRLCQSCHTIGHGNPGAPNVNQAFNRACQNCHSQIHGSNAPAGVLFQR